MTSTPRSYPNKEEVWESYSADRISSGRPIRRPVDWLGEKWVCISVGPGEKAQLYRLDDVSIAARKYGIDDDQARESATGFYHAIIVKFRSREFQMFGPPIELYFE